MLRSLGLILLVLLLSKLKRHSQNVAYLSLHTPANHDLYISARNRAKSVLRLTKYSYNNRKCQNLAFCNSSWFFWLLEKNISNTFTFSAFPPLLLPDDTTTVSSVSKAALFFQTFSNSTTLDDSGHIPQLISTLNILCLLLRFLLMTFSTPSLALTLRPDGVPPIVVKSCASVLTPCLVKLFWLCISTSIFPSCWKYAYVQIVLEKGDRSNPLNYCPIALLSCLSKAFENILNRKRLKHLSTFDILSDHQYGFRKGCSNGDLLAFLTDSWPSSLSRFGKTFAVALDISKAFWQSLPQNFTF